MTHIKQSKPHGGKSDVALGSIFGGATSAFVSTTALQPLDVLKTRIQEAAVTGKADRGRIISNVAKQVYNKYGIFGFWNGLSASLWRNIPGIAIYFGTLNTTMTAMRRSNPSNDQYSPFLLAAVSGSSRIVASTILFPFTFVKTRYESRKFSYSGILHTFRQISENEGRSVLFRGFWPTMVRDVPFSAIYFPIYTEIKGLYSQGFSQHFTQSAIGHFSAGCLAGAAASIVTQPADVIKTHMQLEPVKFSSVWKTIRTVIQVDGIFGLFRGSLVRITRRTIITSVNWTLFERFMGEVAPSSERKR